MCKNNALEATALLEGESLPRKGGEDEEPTVGSLLDGFGKALLRHPELLVTWGMVALGWLLRQKEIVRRLPLALRWRLELLREWVIPPPHRPRRRSARSRRRLTTWLKTHGLVLSEREVNLLIASLIQVVKGGK